MAMSDTPIVYVVVRGDSLSKIARAHGLSSWRALYDAPENADFRRRRPNPNLIHPGDRVVIPARKPGAPSPRPPRRTGGSSSSGRSSSGGGRSSSSSSSSSSAPVSHGGMSSMPGGGGMCTPDDPYGDGGMSTDPWSGGMSTDPWSGGMSYDPWEGGMSTPSGGTQTSSGNPPETITADLVTNSAYKLPEKFIKFLLTVLGAAKDDSGKQALTFLRRRTDAAEGIAALYKSWRHFEAGQNQYGVSNAFKGIAKIWKALTPAMRRPAVKSLEKAMRRIPKFGVLADVLEPIDRCDGIASLLLLLSALIKGDGKDARTAAKDFVDALKKNPGEAARIGPTLLQFFAEMIPARTRGKMLAKMAGKKVPVAGTIVVGITDVWSIWSDPSDWTRWAGLGSTLVALVPLAGTALSVVIDLAIVIGTIIDNIGDLQLAMNRNPFAD